MGDFQQAIDLYTAAEDEAASVSERLFLSMRRAYCLIDLGQMQPAVEIARAVVAEGREDDILPEVCDALGLLVDDHMNNDRVADATRLLAEARYLLDQLPDDPSVYQVVHNLAVTYERCDFPAAALELLERALRLAESSDDKAFVLSNMAATHHLAMMDTQDPAERTRQIDAGIRAASDVIDSPESKEVVSLAGALAHRAVLLNERGDHEQALRDALLGRELAAEHGLNTELVVSLIGEATARWNLFRDPDCVDLLDQAWTIAANPWIRRFPAAAWRMHLEALWETGRYEEAREMMVRRQDELERSVQRERAGRLAHVHLGVEHHHTERMSETDPLTGLYNRRHLAVLLPLVLDGHGPVCVAVFDLDGFKEVNDEFSYEQGDRVLQQMGRLLTQSCRSGDCVGRLGGDEFVMVLCQITPSDARLVLERVRELIAATEWDGMPEAFRLTSSVGVAIGTVVADSRHIIADASSVLRQAKRAGRNQIVFC